MHLNTRRLTLYSVLFALISMSVFQDSSETVTELDVKSMLKDTGQQPVVTGSNHWSDWSPSRIIDGIYSNGNAGACNCCAALPAPALANINLTKPFLISRIVVLGRTDGDNVGEQFQNIKVSAGRTDVERLFLDDIVSNTTSLVAKPYPPRLFQYVSVSSPSQFFTICEMHLFAYTIGELVGGVARQSSIYGQCTADKAQDNKRIFYDSASTCTCSVTNSSMGSFWEIDLSEQHLIQHIEVTGRTGHWQSKTLVAYIGDSQMGYETGERLNDPDSTNTGLYIHLDPPRLARYINIKKSDHRDVMTICEVEVFKTVTHTTDADNHYYEFENTIPGIQIHNLWDYIRDNKKKRCQRFNDEFAKLPTGLVHPHNVAAREEYKGKNRYREMYAYDHSRVPLQKERDVDCDYINASYIDGYGKVRKFIASQGPTQNMIDDFWRMVWQENAEKIVMLTNLIEMATVKCLQYWPEMDETCSFGGIDISVTAVEEFRDYEIRTLIAKKAQSKSRRIQQYHFKAWPDKDVPDNGWCLVEFLNAVETQSTNAPIIVHCSAGVGRTGTFIALDNLVDQARTEKCVRPLQMVEALRRQRVNMVQTKDQYIYLHEALAESLLTGNDHVWHRQFEEVHHFMMATEPGEKQPRMVKQFQLIEQSLTNEAQQVQDGPEYGNMETILSEIDAYLPKLKKRGSNFTQQLGAILLPGFSGKNAFLLCKSPSEEQLEEFWSLVEEQHVITVIMLTSTSSRAHKTCVYMGGNRDGKVGRYSVNFIQERKNKTFNERSFSFRDDNNEDEDYLTTMKQFQFTAWTENETLPPMQNMLDCLDAVRKWQPHLAENRPVLIHCETGDERSGLIAVLLNELHRMEKTRGQINIVETVKTMKQRNRDIIPNTVQYKFIYDSLLEHVQNSTEYENIKSA